MMTSRRVLLALMLVAASTFVACERTDEVGGLTGPQYAKTAKEMKILQRVRAVDLEQVCTTERIGRGGGTLAFDGGFIEVTRNAVQTPTIFCAQNIGEGNQIKIKLTAWNGGNGNLQPVTQFRSPIRLTIDLSDAIIGDWATSAPAIKVVYHNYLTNTLDPQPTSQSRDAKNVTAQLSHFSDYSPVEN